jgi:hypothetical protein
MECPRKYKAQYIEKIYKFEGNVHTRRGVLIHDLMFREINRLINGGPPVVWPENEKRVEVFAKEVIEALDFKYFLSEGWYVSPEKELAVDREGRKVGWYDNDAYIRSRLDLLVVSPDLKKYLIVDWKTGKTPGFDLQLPLNILSLPEGDRRHDKRYDGAFVYLDLRKVDIRSDFGFMSLDIYPFDRRKSAGGGDTAESAADYVLDLEEAWRDDDFRTSPGSYCRWCEVKSLGACDAW